MLKRAFFPLVLAVGSFMLVGCGEAETTSPPPGTEAKTPSLDIEEGTAASPEEVTEKGKSEDGAGEQTGETE